MILSSSLSLYPPVTRSPPCWAVAITTSSASASRHTAQLHQIPTCMGQRVQMKVSPSSDTCTSKHVTAQLRTRCSQMGGKNAWFQPFEHARNFRNLGNRVILVFFRVWNTHNRVILVFSRIMTTCSEVNDKFLSALVLCIVYTDEEYSDQKPWRNDHVVIVLLFTL